MILKVLDLFSGIGGFSLGLERTQKFKTAAFCEINQSCRDVLQKHWPDVKIFTDIKKITADELENYDVITGGFPCQDISVAGKGQGITGPKSSLWFEFQRIISIVRPSYVIIENTTALRNRGMEAVLYGLYEIGYDAEWHCIPASAIGALHQRDRIWIVAYPKSNSCRPGFCQVGAQLDWSVTPDCCCSLSVGQFMAEFLDKEISSASNYAATLERDQKRIGVSDFWSSEPRVDRVVDGLSGRVDRFIQLGNTVVPQVVELIGYSIIEYEKRRGLCQNY